MGLFEADLLIRGTMSLRVVNVVLWSIIASWGALSTIRMVRKRHDREDYLWSSLLMLAISLFIFQFRAIAGLWSPPLDGWSAIALAGFALSALGLFFYRSRAAPTEHRRAVMISYLTLLLFLIAAGLLA